MTGGTLKIKRKFELSLVRFNFYKQIIITNATGPSTEGLSVLSIIKSSPLKVKSSFITKRTMMDLPTVYTLRFD